MACKCRIIFTYFEMVLFGWQQISQTSLLLQQLLLLLLESSALVELSELLSEHLEADTATLHVTTTLQEVLPPFLEAAETATADEKSSDDKSSDSESLGKEEEEGDEDRAMCDRCCRPHGWRLDF